MYDQHILDTDTSYNRIRVGSSDYCYSTKIQTGSRYGLCIRPDIDTIAPGIFRRDITLSINETGTWIGSRNHSMRVPSPGTLIIFMKIQVD